MTISGLPREIVIQILSYLPLKEKVASVCKLWNLLKAQVVIMSCQKECVTLHDLKFGLSALKTVNQTKDVFAKVYIPDLKHYWRSLKKITIENIPLVKILEISKQFLKQFAQLFPDVELELSLKGQRFADVHVVQLVQELPFLTSLDISNTTISCRGLLLFMKQYQKLKIIHLQNTIFSQDEHESIYDWKQHDQHVRIFLE